MPKTRKDLTVSQKNELLQRYDELRKQRTTQRTAASTLGIAQSTLATLLKQRSNFKLQEDEKTSRKRHRLCNHKDIDEALLIWFNKERHSSRVSRNVLREKAMKFAKQFHVDGFTCSDGWIARWKSRHGVVLRTSCVERPDLEVVDEWVESVLPTILKEFEPQNVYNCDETGLHFRALPDHSFIFRTSDTSEAGRRHKEHCTVLLTCNMDGSEKLDPLVIGKSKNPRCFKAVKRLPIPYEANGNGCMTCGVFESFLRQWNAVLASCARRIALVLDNCTAHPNVELTHIKLVFIPENTASYVQPLDQGITKAFKAHYRREMRRRISFELDSHETCLKSSEAFHLANKITVLDAIHMIRDAWDAVTPTTISNCFRHVKTASNDADLDVTDEQDEESDGVDDDEAWASIDDQLITAAEDVSTSQEAENQTDDEDLEYETPNGKCLREAFSVIRQLVYTSDRADRSHVTALKTLENLAIHTAEKHLNQNNFFLSNDSF